MHVKNGTQYTSLGRTLLAMTGLLRVVQNPAISAPRRYAFLYHGSVWGHCHMQAEMGTESKHASGSMFLSAREECQSLTLCPVQTAGIYGNRVNADMNTTMPTDTERNPITKLTRFVQHATQRESTKEALTWADRVEVVADLGSSETAMKERT